MAKRFRAQQNSKTTKALIQQKAVGRRHIFSAPSTGFTKQFYSVSATYLINELVAADFKGLDPLQGIVREHLAHDIQRLVVQPTTGTHEQTTTKKGREGVIRRTHDGGGTYTQTRSFTLTD